MIRINLLPFRAARKKENIRRQISLFLLLGVFLLLAMGYFYFDLNRQLGSLAEEKDQKQKELENYALKGVTIGDIQKKTEEIRAKM